MKSYLNRLPPEFQDLLHLTSETAYSKGMPVYLVGGFVRDLILRVKNLDIDIVVEGDGIALAQDLSGKLNAKLITHRMFGTATVIVNDGLKIDIATARKEIYPAPAKLPIVAFGTLKDDLKRRDFTINAMAINITEADFGTLIDFYNGKSDLLNKKIRILHGLSFIDDPTRILRAIRFERRFDFKIETDTLKYLKRAVRGGMLEKVEPQRLRDEMILLLKEQFPVKHIRRINNLCGFGFLSGKLKLSQITYKLLGFTQKEIDWFKEKHYPRRRLDTWLIYFIALIDSLDISETKKVCKRFVFRKGEEKRILSFKRTQGKFAARLGKEKIKPYEIFTLLEPLSYEVIILIKAKYRRALVKKRIEDFLEIYNDIRICISGRHLHGLGVKPGPHYTKIFAGVLKAKLNGLVKTEEEELNLIKLYIKKNNLSDS